MKINKLYFTVAGVLLAALILVLLKPTGAPQVPGSVYWTETSGNFKYELRTIFPRGMRQEGYGLALVIKDADSGRLFYFKYIIHNSDTLLTNAITSISLTESDSSSLENVSFEIQNRGIQETVVVYIESGMPDWNTIVKDRQRGLRFQGQPNGVR